MIHSIKYTQIITNIYIFLQFLQFYNYLISTNRNFWILVDIVNFLKNQNILMTTTSS